MATEAKKPSLWSSLTGKARLPESSGAAEMALGTLLKDYELVHVEDKKGEEYAIVTRLSEQDLREIGSSSPSPWTSFTRQEYNPALQGMRGLEKWDQMRKGDGTVRGTLRLLKTPVFAGRWFVEAEPDNTEQAEIAKFLWCNMTEYMTITWHQVLSEALLMCDFGYYMFEKVWENRMVHGELRTVLVKLAPRHPMDVDEWILDAHGGPVAVRMHTEVDEHHPDGTVRIPIEKLLVFTFEREAGNIEGISALRSAYKHWYFKEQLYKIDAIQKERHGIGIPVIELPLGFGDDDKKAAQNLGRNLRTNESAHVVLPPSWKLYMLKLEGNPVDALRSIEHHNEAIRENILVNFVTEGATADDISIFMKASRFVADIVAETFSLYLFPQMVEYNWPDSEYIPKLRVRRIGENADWRTLTFAIRNLVGAGIIIPDEDLEVNIRQEMDLPPINKDTARLIATPQNPYDINEDIGEADPNDPYGDSGTKPADARAGEGSQDDPVHNNKSPQYNKNRRKLKKGRLPRGGLPRQTTMNKVRNSYGVPAPHAGTDKSGGK